MRILYICSNVIGHGTYLRAYEFARCLASQNHRVTLMAVSKNRRVGIQTENENGIEIIATPDIFGGSLRSGWDPVNALTRIKFLSNEKYDLVHSFEARPICFYPARHLQKRGFPLFLDWSDWLGRGGSVEQRPNPLLRTVLRPVESYFENRSRKYADGNTVICSTLYRKALSLGVNPDHLSLIPNGFEIPGWKTFPKKKARQILNLGENEFIVGYVGSLFPGDADMMIRAFRNLQKRIPQSRLIHIGRSNYSSTMHPSVIFTGNIHHDRLCQYLSACDVCWLPFEDTNANRGRFPLKFSNYLAAGKPIVATEVGDVAEYIRMEEVGLTCDPTSQALADVVYSLYENPEAMQGYAQRAKYLGRNPDHTWLARTAELMRIYRKII